MSLILEGIDLPEKNMKVICLFPNGAEELVVLNADSGAIAGRPIQAIQIPKNHGNLKDENEIKKNSIDDDYDLYVSWTDIDNAPTILEAEE